MATDLTSFTTIKAEQRDAVVWVWLDRPEKYHAFNKVMCDELSGLWRSLKTDDSVRSVVLTATGDKAFCTGGDQSDHSGQYGDGSTRGSVGMPVEESRLAT